LFDPTSATNLARTCRTQVYTIRLQIVCGCSGSGPTLAESRLTCDRPHWIGLWPRIWPGRVGCDAVRSGSKSFAGCPGSGPTLDESGLSCVRPYWTRHRPQTWPGRVGRDAIRSGSESYAGCSGSDPMLVASVLSCIRLREGWLRCYTIRLRSMCGLFRFGSDVA
jgi:hypothetical protein